MATEERDVKVRFETEGDGAEPFQQGADAVETFEERTERLNESLSELEKDLDRIDQNLGIPNLAKSAEKAETEMKELSAAIERGFEGAEGRVARAKLAVSRYADELRSAKAAGVDVTETHIRKLQELESEYQDATRQVGEFRAAQQAARRDVDATTTAAGGQVQQLNSLDDVLEHVGGKWGSFGVKALAAFAALEKGWEIGTKLRGVLNEISDGGFDANLQRSFEGLAGALVGAADASDLTRNQISILAKNDIPTLGLNAAQVDAVYQKFTAGLRDNAAAAGEASSATEDLKNKTAAWLAGLDLLPDALGNSAIELAQFVSKALDEFDIPKDALAKKVEPLVQALIEKFATAGEEIHPALQHVIDALGIVPKGVDEVAGKTETGVERLKAALADLSQAKPDLSGFEVGKNEMKAAVDQMMLESGRIDVATAEMAASFGVFVPPMKVAGYEMSVMSGGLGSLEAALKGAGLIAKDSAESYGEVGDKVADAATKTDAAAEKFKVAGDKAGEGAEGLDKQATAAGDAGTGIGEAAAATTQLLTEQEKVTEALANTTAALDQQVDEITATFGGLGDSIKQAFDGLDDIDAPLQGALDRIIAKADTVIAKLREIQNIDGAGGAPAGAPN